MSALGQKWTLFDHFIGPRKHGRRYGSAHRFRGLEIDQLILGRRLHGHVARSAAVQSSVSWKMLGVRVSFDVFAPLWMQ
jgi:hypothetical protein